MQSYCKVCPLTRYVVYLSVMCCLWHECIVTKWLKLSLLKSTAMPQLFVFKVGGTVSQKQVEVEFRSRSITDRKSCLGFWFMHKSMTLNGLNSYTINGNHKVICQECNVRLMLVEYWTTCLHSLSHQLHIFHVLRSYVCITHVAILILIH